MRYLCQVLAHNYLETSNEKDKDNLYKGDYCVSLQSCIMNAMLAISLLVCLTGATAFQEVSSPEYIALTAAEKSEIIWRNVMEDLTPADWFGILELPGIFTESMCPTLRAPGKRLRCER